MRSSSCKLSTRSLKMSVGSAANGGASAPTTSKFRSGIRLSSRAFHLEARRTILVGTVYSRACRSGFRFDAREVVCDRLPCLLAAAQTAPGDANEADELVAGVNGDNVVLAAIAHAIDEQCLDIRLHFVQDGIGAGKLLPAFQVQQRFHCPCRAGIEG